MPRHGVERVSAPGWYLDPAGSGQQRYYDGQQWTNQYAPSPLRGHTPQRKSRAGLWVLLGVLGAVILGFGGCVAFFGAVGSKSGSSSLESAGGVGQSVRDGKFEFRVNNVSTTGRVGLPSPRGQWVVADVTVTNIGNEPQSFFVGNQKLLDTSGREYAADDMAAIRINPDAMVFDLGPGLSVNALLPFDVPPGTPPAALVLHDSAFSGGVRVDVS